MGVKAFFASKTNWTAIIGGLTALGAYMTGELELVPAIQSGFAALSVLFLRAGVAKSGP